MKKTLSFLRFKRITLILAVTVPLFFVNRAASQGLIEYVLLGSGINCGLPVIIIPDSVYHDLVNTEVQIEIDEVDDTGWNPSVYSNTFDLQDTTRFEYLGYVQFVTGDTTSRRHGYRLKFPYDYSITPGEIALFILFTYHNSEWISSTESFMKSCLQCPVAPSRVKAMFYYTMLPNIIFNDASIPYSGYSGDYAGLEGYQK